MRAAVASLTHSIFRSSRNNRLNKYCHQLSAHQQLQTYNVQQERGVIEFSRSGRRDAGGIAANKEH
jgi:hypothetical protein